MKRLIAIFLLTVLLVGCGADAPVSEETKPTADTEATQQTTETSETTEEPTTQAEVTAGYGNNSYSALSNYSVTAAAPDDETMMTPIAINAAGDTAFENRQLQIAFWTEYMNFMSTYGDYAYYFGLDTTLPLYEQEYGDGITWEQRFLQYAATGLANNYALSNYAYANGYVLSEEDQATIDDIADPNGSFAAEYTALGFTDADSYIQYYFGAGVDAATYQEYNRMYFAAADAYYDKLEELQTTITEEDVEAYYDANAEVLGLPKCNNINVRHILIQPDGDQTEWTEEDLAAAKAEAEALYAEWLTNPTEENFIALATEKTMDPGSQETGGLYEEVEPGTMVTEFNDWCFDESRQAGDHGIVETTYGYHIMYFVGEGETRAWYDSALDELIYSSLEAFVAECLEAYPISIDYTLVRIYDVVSAQATVPVG